MNIVLLWGEAEAKGYAAPIWMTYKQAQEIGGQVRKGERGSLAQTDPGGECRLSCAR